MVNFVEMDDDTKVHAMKYLTRTYGKHVSEYVSNNKPVSDYDMKMIFTIQKLRNSYKKYEKSVKTAMLTRYEIDNLNATKNVPIVKMTKEKPSKEKPVMKYCPAIKMDGQVCNCKIQNNGNFCGRHLKKKP